MPLNAYTQNVLALQQSVASIIKPYNPEWMARLDEAQDDTLNSNESLLELKNKLVAFAGHNACLTRHEPDLFELLEKGVFIAGENILMEPGEPCRCHDNVALLADEHEHVAIMTGYGLSVDGLWRQHSWCINTLNDQLIETTAARLIYFGIVVD